MSALRRERCAGGGGGHAPQPCPAALPSPRASRSPEHVAGRPAGDPPPVRFGAAPSPPPVRLLRSTRTSAESSNSRASR